MTEETVTINTSGVSLPLVLQRLVTQDRRGRPCLKLKVVKCYFAKNKCGYEITDPNINQAQAQLIKNYLNRKIIEALAC